MSGTGRKADAGIQLSDFAAIALSVRHENLGDGNITGFRRWAGPISVAASIVFLAGSLATLEVLWIALSPLMAIGFLIWVPAIAMTLRQRKWLWALASLPAISFPLYIFGAIVAACARGDCL